MNAQGAGKSSVMDDEVVVLLVLHGEPSKSQNISQMFLYRVPSWREACDVVGCQKNRTTLLVVVARLLDKRERERGRENIVVQETATEKTRKMDDRLSSFWLYAHCSPLLFLWFSSYFSTFSDFGFQFLYIIHSLYKYIYIYIYTYIILFYIISQSHSIADILLDPWIHVVERFFLRRLEKTKGACWIKGK